jgi:hypothetical protein
MLPVCTPARILDGTIESSLFEHQQMHLQDNLKAEIAKQLFHDQETYKRKESQTGTHDKPLGSSYPCGGYQRNSIIIAHEKPVSIALNEVWK